MYAVLILTYFIFFYHLCFVICEDSIVNNGSCAPYNSVLPSGMCLEYMKDAYVLFNVTDARKTDSRDTTLFVILIPSFLRLIASTSENKFKRHVYDSLINLTCFGKSDTLRRVAKELADNIPSYDVLQHLFDLWKWFVCHVNFPVCINNDKDKISLPCKHEYDIALMRHKITRIFVNHRYEMAKDCSQWFKSDPAVFQRRYALTSDIRHIEKCQKYINISASTQQPYTSGCYNDIGLTYNGTVKLAENGNTCILWNSIPALRSNIYSNLIKNYCRNPQGYGERPWCYTDAQSRDWSYCHIEKCGKHESHFNMYIILYVIICQSCFGFVATLVYLRIKKQRREKMEDIDPDYVYHLYSPEQIEHLLYNM